MDELDRDIVNHLQGGFPLCDRPYAAVARDLGTSEDELIERLQTLRADGRLTRFGPLYNVEKMGGEFVLCAMRVPKGDFDRVSGQVNAFAEVAHNYERRHQFNMWFVIAGETTAQVAGAVGDIEAATGLDVYQFPKLREYYVGFRLDLRPPEKRPDE